jgi:hypothetical protein
MVPMILPRGSLPRRDPKPQPDRSTEIKLQALFVAQAIPLAGFQVSPEAARQTSAKQPWQIWQPWLTWQLRICKLQMPLIPQG